MVGSHGLQTSVPDPHGCPVELLPADSTFNHKIERLTIFTMLFYYHVLPQIV